MARYEFKLPDIGEGVTEGEIVSWADGVAVGATVQAEQPLVEVMTDKATVVIPSPKAGVILELGGKVGDVIAVGKTLVVFDVGATGAVAAAPTPAAEAPAPVEPKAEAPASKPKEPKAEAPAPTPKEPKAEAPAPTPKEPKAEAPAPTTTEPKAAAPKAEPAAAPAVPAAASDEPAPSNGPSATAAGSIPEELPGMAVERSATPPTARERTDKPLAAPATRLLARELGVDLRDATATGPHGRVTQDDVRALAGASDATRQPANATAAPGRPPIAIETSAREERVPLRGMRKRIFEQMARSKHTAAHFTFVEECDVTALSAMRTRLAPIAEQADARLSFLPFIIKACVAALKKHPTLNAAFDESTQEIVIRKYYDIGVAAATEAGLMVPVVRGADALSLLEISREVQRLSADAKVGKIKREDLLGSTFTITSLGKQGGLFATPILNFPEVAILGVHQIKQRPVVRDGQIVIGQVMLLSLSFDHRIIDGHIGAAFAYEVIGYLENPDRLLLEMR